MKHVSVARVANAVNQPCDRQISMLLGIRIVLISEEYTENNYQVMTGHHVARSSPKMRGENGARSPRGIRGKGIPTYIRTFSPGKPTKHSENPGAE